MKQHGITPAIGKAYVRVIGIKLGKFIEFEFCLNDDDLCVELVMPEPAFREFCAQQGAEIRPSEHGDDIADLLSHRAGLYRPPVQ